MKKMLMLGTGYGSREMIRYAKSQGIYTIVTDYLEPQKSVAKLESDEYWMINTAEVALLEKKCREEKIGCIICGVSEFNLEIAMELCERLGLQIYCTKEAWHYSRDKHDFKKLCREVNAPLPTDYYISEALSEEELDSVIFPVVVKPVDMSANRGVSYCYNKQELVEAYRYVRFISKSSKVIVERMLRGKEWYGTYAMADGEISLIALNAMYSEPGEPANCYSITTTVSDHVERYVNEINPKIIEVLKKVGCREGIAWVQVMLDEDDHFYIIEMGYRLDGDMMFIPYRGVCNFDAIKWLIDYSFGKRNLPDELPAPQTKAFRRCGCGYMLWVNKGGVIAEIKGLDIIAQIPGVLVDSFARAGDAIRPYSYLAVITFDTDDCEKMCEMIEKVNDTVRIINTEGENVLIYYTDFDHLKKIYKDGLEGK